MNKSVIVYIACFGLAVGMFQNCTRQQFGTLSSPSSGAQGATSFDPIPLDPTGTPDPVIGTLVPTANPSVLSPGDTTTVSVAMTNIDRVDYVCAVASDLSSKGVFRQGTLTPTQTSFVISPTETSGCRFTGYGSKLAAPVTADLPIVVKSPTFLVGSLSVTASPSTVAPGQSTSINAVMTNITSVTYVCAAGLDVSGAPTYQGTLSPGAPSFALAPTQTTTCRFTGSGPNLAGPVITSITVTVNQPEPVVGSLVVTANPPAIIVGQSTFITAQMTNITSVAYSCAAGADGSGTVFWQDSLTPSNPSFAISPTQTSLCQFRGTGPNLANPVLQSLVIVVNPPAQVIGSFDVNANPASVVRGGNTTVAATGFTNISEVDYTCAADADMNGAVIQHGALTANSPSFVFTPTQTSTCHFTGVGQNLAAPVTKTLNVVVTEPAPQLVNGSFDVNANPPSFTRGGSTTITATSIVNLTSVGYACTAADGSVLAQGNLSAGSPSFPFTSNQSATCTFNGSGPNLTAVPTRSLSITVNDPPPPPPPPPGQTWTWQGILFQTTHVGAIYDGVEYAYCVGPDCAAPKIQCYSARPWQQPGHPIGSVQYDQPSGYKCYLRQQNDPWITR